MILNKNFNYNFNMLLNGSFFKGRKTLKIAFLPIDKNNMFLKTITNNFIFITLLYILIYYFFSQRVKGALTRNEYAFTNRPWSLKYIRSLDIFDEFASNIIINAQNFKNFRILPLKNDLINREFISDKIRFFIEKTNEWRFNMPLIKKKKYYKICSWASCYYYIFLNLYIYNKYKKINNVTLILKNLVDSNFLLNLKHVKNIFNFLKKKKNVRKNDFYYFYINKNLIKNLNIKKNIFLFGTNLREENPMFNVKLNNIKLKKKLNIFYLGFNKWDNLNCILISLNFSKIKNLLNGKTKNVKNILKNINYSFKNINKILFILGKKIKNVFSENILLKKMKLKIKKINDMANLTGCLNKFIFLEMLNINKKKNNNFFFYIFYKKLNKKNYKNIFEIFQGNTSYSFYNAVLPSAHYIEKNLEFLNIFGLLQKTNIASFFPLKTKNDWKIINSFTIFTKNFLTNIYKIKSKKNINKINLLKKIFTKIKNIKKKLKKISPNMFFIELTNNEYVFYLINSVENMIENTKKYNV